MANDELPGVYARTDMGWTGYGTWRYRILPEPELSQMLERSAQPMYHAEGRVSSVTFQPCLSEEEASQDRRTADLWEMPNGKWTFLAVFDGHAGHEAAEFTVENLPAQIKDELAFAFTKDKAGVFKQPSAEFVSALLSKCITGFDTQIRNDFLLLFPGGLNQVTNMPVEEVRALINDEASGGSNHAKAVRCMRGTTALIALMDPDKENLWVANLGDCQATLGKEDEDGKSTGTLVTQNHNASNPVEAERVLKEHPTEPGCILHERVLGAITVTRAIGDFAFKLPPVYTRKIFMNTHPGFRVHAKIEELISRSFSPPYLSNVPEIHHISLTKADKYLILCSDGLTDLYPENPDAPDEWVQAIMSGEVEGQDTNNALSILRNAIGATNCETVSRNMTVEMETRWMDDTTVLVLEIWR